MAQRERATVGSERELLLAQRELLLTQIELLLAQRELLLAQRELLLAKRDLLLALICDTASTLIATHSSVGSERTTVAMYLSQAVVTSIECFVNKFN